MPANLPAQHANTGTTIEWGTDSGTTYGIVQSVEENHDGAMAEAKDHTGKTVAVEHYDDTATVTISTLLTGGAAIPAVGTIVTLGSGDKYLVQNTRKTASNEQFTQLAITAKAYAGITLG